MNFATAPSNAIDALVATVFLALAHVATTQLRHIAGKTTDRLLMAGAGVSLTYILLYILPRLSSKQDIMRASEQTGLLGSKLIMDGAIGLLHFSDVPKGRPKRVEGCR